MKKRTTLICNRLLFVKLISHNKHKRNKLTTWQIIWLIEFHIIKAFHKKNYFFISRNLFDGYYGQILEVYYNGIFKDYGIYNEIVFFIIRIIITTRQETNEFNKEEDLPILKKMLKHVNTPNHTYAIKFVEIFFLFLNSPVPGSNTMAKWMVDTYKENRLRFDIIKMWLRDYEYNKTLFNQFINIYNFDNDIGNKLLDDLIGFRTDDFLSGIKRLYCR